MAWTDQQRAEFRDAVRAAAAAHESSRIAWLAKARGQADDCARVLADEFGASRVVLFGSVARGTGRPGSDVDLLVAGVEPRRWFDAVARATDIVSCGQVDLVPAERVHAHIAARVAEEGVVLVG